MTTKQKILSKDIWVRTAETQPFFAFLSIIQNFSLSFLCKALHNKPGVKHWHGAAPDSWFSHLAVEVPGENCRSQWCEPVSEEEYQKLK